MSQEFRLSLGESELGEELNDNCIEMNKIWSAQAPPIMKKITFEEYKRASSLVDKQVEKLIC